MILPTGKRRRPATLIMLTLVVAIVLSISGCFSPPGIDEDLLTVNITIELVVPRDSGNGTVWDATVHINKITPNDSSVIWSGLKVGVRAPDGTVLLKKTVPGLDTGSYSGRPETWYVDSVGDRDMLDPSDEVLITGMGKEFESAGVEFHYKGERVAQMILWLDFP